MRRKRVSIVYSGIKSVISTVFVLLFNIQRAGKGVRGSDQRKRLLEREGERNNLYRNLRSFLLLSLLGLVALGGLLREGGKGALVGDHGQECDLWTVGSTLDEGETEDPLWQEVENNMSDDLFRQCLLSQYNCWKEKMGDKKITTENQLGDRG